MAETVESALDRTRGSRRWLRYGMLTVVAILILFPMYVMVIFALKPGVAIFSYPRALLPVDLTLDTLHDAWTQGHFARYLVNSAIVSLASVFRRVRLPSDEPGSLNAMCPFSPKPKKHKSIVPEVSCAPYR
jgi:ABC-type glycerol-3-phosphate transport system permease component